MCVVGLFQLLWVRPGHYPRDEHLKGASPNGQDKAGEACQGANTLAYYKHSNLTYVKSFFLTLDPVL
jgi:hypothetical protein